MEHRNNGDDEFVSARELAWWPEALMRNFIRPAAKCAGVTKQISWHTFRHTFSTLLAENGEDLKTLQSMMRQANPRLTLEIYTHAEDKKKRAAQAKVIEMILPTNPAEPTAGASA